jgi:hypothetical protein
MELPPVLLMVLLPLLLLLEVGGNIIHGACRYFFVYICACVTSSEDALMMH